MQYVITLDRPRSSGGGHHHGTPRRHVGCPPGRRYRCTHGSFGREKDDRAAALCLCSSIPKCSGHRSFPFGQWGSTWRRLLRSILMGSFAEADGPDGTRLPTALRLAFHELPADARPKPAQIDIAAKLTGGPDRDGVDTIVALAAACAFATPGGGRSCKLSAALLAASATLSPAVGRPAITMSLVLLAKPEEWLMRVERRRRGRLPPPRSVTQQHFYAKSRPQ